MDISPSVRDRIITAAETLYEESGRRSIPTVDAVRKLAKVNINDASNCMREWRRTNAMPAGTPSVQVPDKLQQTCITALHTLWTEAVNLSGETLRMAQAGWDAERADAKILNEQVGNACAALEEELRAANAEIEKITRENLQLGDLLNASRGRAEVAERAVIELRTAASQEEVRWMEISKRADDLRQMLDRTHATHAVTSNEQSALLRAQREEIAQLRKELEEARNSSESREANGRAELLAAIGEAARLRGKLDAISDENGSVPTQLPLSKKDNKQSQ